MTGLAPLATPGVLLRGGEAVGATMCDTIPIVESQVVVITFVKLAGVFLNFAEEDEFFVGWNRAHVTMVNEATYPTRRILQDHMNISGYTCALTASWANGQTKIIVYKLLSNSIVAEYIEGYRDHPIR